jgi:A/G-specific adenine glycosylase
LKLPIPQLRTALLDWYRTHGRQLPWRWHSLSAQESTPPENPDPYAIWISEIMLQQTQVKTVLPYFDRWLTQYPNLTILAHADQQEILKQWQGLGYYARARNLHRAAQIILSQHQGIFPQTYDDVLALPGIGRSTAGAILSSAFNQPHPILDGNVKRVIARLIALPQPPAQALSELWLVSEQLLDPQHPRDFNQAFMDLGATICLPKKPRCADCPWQQFCQAAQLGLQAELPQRQASAPLPHKLFGVAVIRNPQGKILIDRRPTAGLLGGLWEFPSIQMEDPDSIVEELRSGIQEILNIQISIESQLITINHAYTHFRVTLIVHHCCYLSGDPQPLASDEIQWISINDWQQFPFSKANLKIIQALINS